MISITELAKLFSTTIRTIRYYEEIGLIEEATRIKGMRYFNENEVIHKMNNIIFLKSLHFPLKDIKMTLENSLFVKPLLLNIRLGFVQIEIKQLIDEINQILMQLQYYNWKPLEIAENNIFNKLNEGYSELSYKEQAIDKKKTVSIEDSINFVEFYKTWHEKVGIKLSDEHIKTIAFNKNIILTPNLKSAFQTYCK